MILWSFSYFFPLFLCSINENVKNVVVTIDPCYSDYESDDESNNGSSNSEIDIKDFEKKNH